MLFACYAARTVAHGVTNNWVHYTFPLFRRCFLKSVPIEEFVLDAFSDDGLLEVEKVEITISGMSTNLFCKEVAVNVTSDEVKHISLTWLTVTKIMRMCTCILAYCTCLLNEVEFLK